MPDGETDSADLLTSSGASQAPWRDLAGRYELLGEIGAGGMGIVCKARDRETGAIVAIKILKPELASDPTISGRFKNELLLARKITHKNVCRIHEFARAGTVAYITMEYIEGESLRSLLKRRGKLPVDEALRIARQICWALVEAHAVGVVHRDLKPENVMLDRQGTVKLMDFGIARSIDTNTGVTVGFVGTPAYMAPEQASGHPVDARTDLYAVGLILYEMLTGQPTFIGDTLMGVALKHMNERPRPPRELEPAIPPAVERAILRCLEKEPDRRFASADELEHLLAVDVAATAAARPGRLGAALRRRPVQAAIGAGLVALLAFALLRGGPAPLQAPFREYTLANGMHVVLVEDHTAPTVSLAMTYRVGSRDEKPGHTGLAHFFEHLMFQGSANVGKNEHNILVTANGGTLNGATNWDRTLYFETLPANRMELALFLEADRLSALDLTKENLETQRQTVLEERRLGVENRAYGGTEALLQQTAYPSSSYRHLVVGDAADIRAATLADAREFFRAYYVPANVTVALVGDFRGDSALALVRKYFESIPSRTPPPPPAMDEAAQTAERRRTIEDPFAQATRIDMAYKIPAAHTRDWYALQLLSMLMGSGNSARLNRRLVRDGEVAVAAASAVDERAGPSLFRVMVMLRPGKQPAQAEQLIDDEIAKIARAPVGADELRKAMLQWRRSLSQQFQSTAQRAILFGEASALHQNAGLVNQVERNFERVTPADVQRVARDYLQARNRTVVLTTPAPGRPATPAPPLQVATSRDVPLSSAVRKDRAPRSSDALPVTLPRPVRTTLANGLTALVIEDHRTPVVYVSVNVSAAGPLYDPPDLPGLANVAAQMLDEGTASRTGREIAEQVERTGAFLTTGATPGSAATLMTASGLSENINEWFPLMADVLLNPKFSADELNALRPRLLVQLRQQRATPDFLAYERLYRNVYGTHPAAVTAPDPATVERVSPDALVRWHRERYAPQNTIIGIIGDVDARKVRRLLEQYFGGWPETALKETLPPNPEPAEATGNQRVVLIDRPGSVQATIVVGGLGIDRRSTDYMAMTVMNNVLGEGPAARLFLNLREQKGLTYGVNSSFNALKYPGQWRVTSSMRTEAAAPALREILAEIRRIREEPVPSEELESSKRAVVARFALPLEQPSQILSNWIVQTIYGFSDDYWDTYPAKIMAVNAQEVQAVAQRYLNTDRMQIVVVGDAARLRPSLAQFGQLAVFDASGQPMMAPRPAPRRSP